MSEEQSYVFIDLTWLDLVEDKNVRRFGQEREPEAFLNARLRATSYEELDSGNISHELSKD